MEFIKTDKAPAAIGPYSQGVKAGNMLFVSGQIPLVPETMEIIEGGITAQARQALNNMVNVVIAAGGTVNDIVKVNVYITDMASFGAINEVYAEIMGEHRPARAVVEVSALPKGVDFESECVAYLGGYDCKK